MNLFTDLYSRVDAIQGLLPELVSAEEIASAVTSLDDNAICELVELVAQTVQVYQQFALAASGTISARSSREAGHSGLAQSRGFRTPVALIQQVTGVSRGTAMQQIRVGEALVEAETAGQQLADGEQPARGEGQHENASVRQVPWHEPLRISLIAGSITLAQLDAIKQGLGEPPADASLSLGEGSFDLGAPRPSAESVAAWSLAAERLIVHAPDVAVEELAKQARAIRDLLDPEGAHARYMAKYEARSFRMWTDADGLTHGKFVFDDESAEWIRSIIDTALRPRRGGPRFVSVSEQESAEELKNDPRTNDQLTHDLLIDVLKAGAVADAETVFGTRQAGIRLVQVVNRDEYLTGTQPPVTRFHEGGATLPASMGEKHRCNTGTQTLVVDETGDPLNVGREQRLFTSQQRVALAIRDGGCRWIGCDRPASYCEAHHIDHWNADQGRTDIDRGVLLCSFHHMQLHNNNWKITRDRQGPFMLHPPAKRAAGLQRSSNSAPSPSPSDTGSDQSAVNFEKPRSGFEGTAVHLAGHSSGRLEQVGEGDAACPVELRTPLPLQYGWQLSAPPAKRFRPDREDTDVGGLNQAGEFREFSHVNEGGKLSSLGKVA